MILPLFGFDYGSKSANVTAQNRTNLYTEVKIEKDKTQLVLYRTAGLSVFQSVYLGASPARGTYVMGNFIYVVVSGSLFEVNNAGVNVSRGTLSTTSGNVDMIDNGTQLIIVDGTNGYVYVPGTLTFTTITSNFPNGATTVTFNGSYFLVDDPAHTGRFYKSASYDGLTWAALDFATAESNPDALIRVFANAGQVLMMGAVTIETWGNTGALNFPFSVVQGSPVEWGLAARWSVAKLDNTVAFLAQNLEGQVQVMQMSGYQLSRISTSEIENQINAFTTVSDATAFTYMIDGHSFYQINFPSGNASFLYDSTSSGLAGVPVWSRLISGLTGRHLAEKHVNFINQNIVSDYSQGYLYLLSTNYYTDNGSTIFWKLVSKHLFDNNQQLSVSELWVDMETGVGLTTGQGSNPQVMMRYSKDGGHTWSSSLYGAIGTIGKYLSRLRYLRLGRARDWVFELTGSDAVKVVIMNAGIKMRKGR